MTLDTRQARQLLAELELTSHGTTAAWDSSGGHNAEKPLLPAGEPNPPHIHLRAQLARALTQSQVDRVAHKAREALQAARYAPDRRHVRGTLEWRKAIAQDDRTAKDIARVFDISERTVYNIRREFRSVARAG